jgi:hypothetical protein
MSTFLCLTKRTDYIVSLGNSYRNDLFVMGTPTKPNSRLGGYVLKTFKNESFRAYIPPPLPPNPPLALHPLLPLLEQTNQALGRLDGLTPFLPDPSLFI